MSSLTLNQKPAKEVALREKTKKTAVKAELSYEDALQAIRKYDTCLKEAGKHRMFEPPPPTNEIVGHHIGKGFAVTLVVVTSEIVLSCNGVVIPPGMAGVFIGMGTAITGTFGTLATGFTEKYQRFFSPLKMKKLQREYRMNQRMVSLKEEEFARLEAEILKKAKKPVKVIQRYLEAENRTLVYSGAMGTEGFSIQEKTPMDVWEQELFKIKSSKTRDLESATRKEITA